VRNKLKSPLPLADILKVALRMPISGPSEIEFLGRLWEELVGPRMASRSRPAKASGKKLIVEVASSVWANEFEFLKPDLLEKLRRLPGGSSFNDIRCQIEARSPASMGLKTRPLRSFG
jgi:predicted nucleic acid-binding Zn ribbon protein